ncbi:hypothetical protein [Ulvibacterium marinum]|uniref:Uncharacterized protein n=1 Tax=Ulvibacterium marinum TaxID=2419782 RepID=A0A3B0CDD8_9FLAO|nr:hypothetical protein [Ulvibacterium marinum]RKN82861.1 hypothetical protein D7Z94_03205 [Ulvibacterium marinum]
MKLYYNYFIFKSVFHNRHTLLLFFPAIGTAIFLHMIITNFDKVLSNEMNIEKGLTIFFIMAFVLICKFYIRGLNKLSQTFNAVKYSNFYTATFKLFREKEKRLFHQYVLESIITKDLNLEKFVKQFENSPKWQRILLNELNSDSFKNSLISELDFPRFKSEVSQRFKKSGWIRDYLNYRTPFERAFFITSKYATESSILNNIAGMKEAIIKNINIANNGVQLDAKGLKEDILNVNNTVKEVNLKYRMILNPMITQKQFALILDGYGKESLNNFKAARFSAYFGGFIKYDTPKYNCQNIFLPYTMDLSKDEIKEFIALLRFLMERNVIINDKKVNSDLKMADIVEIFIENCLLSSETIRRNFSEVFAYKKALHQDTMRKVNSIIDRYLPAS